jgi:hypothetical protein
MRRAILLVVLVLLAVVAMALPAFAHSHFVVLPTGECAWLSNGANGGVEGAAHDSVHPLHNTLHVGTAGAQMDNPRNPVDVDKDVNAGLRCSGFVNG